MQQESPAASQASGFRLDLDDALTPDPGTEDMFRVPENKFSFSPGQLSKLLDPKSLNAFYALGGLAGLEKGLRTNRSSGLSVDEDVLDGCVAFEDVATKDAPRYGSLGDLEPETKGSQAPTTTPPRSSTVGFTDRQKVFGNNQLPEKKSKSFLELAWTTYNDKVLILLTIASVVSLSLGLYQTLGTVHEEGEARVEWVEGVAIMVAILIVVAVGTVNDWQMEQQFNKLNKKVRETEREVGIVDTGQDLKRKAEEPRGQLRILRHIGVILSNNQER